MGHGSCESYVNCVMGHMGQWVTKDDPFPSLIYGSITAVLQIFYPTLQPRDTISKTLLAM